MQLTVPPVHAGAKPTTSVSVAVKIGGSMLQGAPCRVELSGVRANGEDVAPSTSIKRGDIVCFALHDAKDATLSAVVDTPSGSAHFVDCLRGPSSVYLSYRVDEGGSYRLNLTADGHAVSGAPFAWTVASEPGRARRASSKSGTLVKPRDEVRGSVRSKVPEGGVDGLCVIVKGDGIERATAGEVAAFTVVPPKIAGRPQSSLGVIQVFVTAPSKQRKAANLSQVRRAKLPCPAL